jgi:Tol biopolymer transport system component
MISLLALYLLASHRHATAKLPNTTIAFTVSENPQKYGAELFLMNLRDKGIRYIGANVVYDEYDAYFDWSPNGEYLAYGIQEKNRQATVIVDRNGKRIWKSPPGRSELPIWWNTNKSLLIMRRSNPADQDLILDLKTKRLKKTGPPRGLSPNGRYDIVSPSGPAMYIKDLRTGHQTLLTKEAEEGQDIAWSPDSKWVACSQNLDGKEGLSVLRTDGSGNESRAKTIVTNYEDHAHDLTWSPDSKLLAFIGDVDSQDEVSAYDVRDSSVHVWAPIATKISGFIDSHRVLVTSDIAIYVVDVLDGAQQTIIWKPHIVDARIPGSSW